MPSTSVCAPKDVDALTITLPAVLRDRMRDEALQDLTDAGFNVGEGADWHRRGVDYERLDAKDRPRLRAAEAIYQQVQGDGDLMLTAPPDRLAVLLRSAAVAAADELRAEVETGVSVRAVRGLLAELSAIADAFARYELGGGAR